MIKGKTNTLMDKNGMKINKLTNNCKNINK